MNIKPSNKSISLLLIENNYDCDLVSKLAKVPLYVVVNTKNKMKSVQLPSPVRIPLKKPTPPELKLNSIMRFGKYKGKKLVKVIGLDADYIKWLLKKEIVTLHESVRFK